VADKRKPVIDESDSQELETRQRCAARRPASVFSRLGLRWSTQSLSVRRANAVMFLAIACGLLLLAPGCARFVAFKQRVSLMEAAALRDLGPTPPVQTMEAWLTAQQFTITSSSPGSGGIAELHLGNGTFFWRPARVMVFYTSPRERVVRTKWYYLHGQSGPGGQSSRLAGKVGALSIALIYGGAGYSIFHAARRKRRIARGCCLECGHDLRGVDHQICPECGAPARDRAGGRGIVGAILAGGLSTRMGGEAKQDLLLPDGRRMIEHVADALGAFCDRIVIVGESRALPHLRRVFDRHPGAGPLGGIEALLAGRADATYIVCPCDIPRISPELLLLLASAPDDGAAVFRADGRVSPLPLRIGAAALPIVQGLLQRGERSVHALIRELDAHVIDVPPEQAAELHNVNSPTDFALLG
jgi:molybdenum cofactor guanylyltransferase